MVCNNCKVDVENRRITCEECGYDNTYVTHTMANAIVGFEMKERVKLRYKHA